MAEQGLQESTMPELTAEQKALGDNVQTDKFTMSDPRGGSGQVGVIAFYHPGRDLEWDRLCGCGFLGNFWPVAENIVFAPTGKDPVTFTNTESAFQACKWWGKAAEFGPTTGHQGFQLKLKYKGKEDFTYGGFGSNWLAMQSVLEAKFTPGSAMAYALLKTGDTFLLEHNERSGRDNVWSDNKTGDGTNWLGLQLMLLRDDLRSKENPDARKPWSEYIRLLMDTQSGKPQSEEARQSWQITIGAAVAPVLQQFP